MAQSPYLEYPNRLSEVIAAIQVMAMYKFYKLDFDQWADRICGDTAKGSYWKTVFIDHPEFFRLDRGKTKASLVWRRNYPKDYDVDQRKFITKTEFLELSEECKHRISRRPLKNDDISVLIDTAIKIHSRDLEYKKDERWKVPLVVSFVGFLFGFLPFLINLLLN